MKGKIAFLKGNKTFGFVEKELPQPEEDALLVKVLCTNICGSDVKNWAGGSSVGTAGDRAACQGHEFVGEICKAGAGVTTDSCGRPVKEGDRVAAPYYITCGECAACRKGRYDLCENAYIHLGQDPEVWPYFGGTFATHYYLHPNQKFYKLPDTLPTELAAGANCAFSQVYYALDRAELQAGETLLIQGAGGLGLYASCIAKEKGARVIIMDGVKNRLTLAKEFGADEIIDLSEVSGLPERLALVKELTGGKGPDVALEVTGHADAFEEGIRHLSVMGRYLVIGINSTAVSAPVSPGYITRKALTVYGVVRYLPEYLDKSLQFLDQHQDKYPFRVFSEQTFSLEELEDALRLSAERKIARAVIRP